MIAFSDRFVSLALVPSATGVHLPAEPTPKRVRTPEDVFIFHIVRSTPAHDSLPVGVEPATFRSAVIHVTSAHVRRSGLQHKVLPFCRFPKCMQQKYKHINSNTYYRPVKIANFWAKHQRNCNINVLWCNIFQTPYIIEL